MNLPNKLTVLRICMITFFVAALLYENGADQTMRIIANVIFITASLTDLLDGKLIGQIHDTPLLSGHTRRLL